MEHNIYRNCAYCIVGSSRTVSSMFDIYCVLCARSAWTNKKSKNDGRMIKSWSWEWKKSCCGTRKKNKITINQLKPVYCTWCTNAMLSMWIVVCSSFICKECLQAEFKTYFQPYMRITLNAKTSYIVMWRKLRKATTST